MVVCARGGTRRDGGSLRPEAPRARTRAQAARRDHHARRMSSGRPRSNSASESSAATSRCSRLCDCRTMTRERADRLSTALSDAANPPLAVARAAAEIAALAQETASLGSPHLLGDAHAGLLFAEAACQAAAGLVVINLQAHPDDERRAEALELARRAAGGPRRVAQHGSVTNAISPRCRRVSTEPEPG